MDDSALQLQGVEDAFPLTPAQAGMLYHTLAAPGTGTYTGVLTATLPADLDVAAFRAACDDVVARHQMLRSQFIWEGLDAPVQVVRDAVEVDWEEGQPPEQLTEALWHRDIDLSRAPAMRLCLASLPDARWHFAWACHHALVDDWSAGIVLREVAALYAERTGGPPAALPPAVPFRDFVDWLAGRDAPAADTHWREALGDYAEPSRVEESHATDSGHGRIEAILSADASARLGAAARRLRVPLADVIATAWGVVLHRLSGFDDVVFGQAVTLRPPELRGMETAVGNFVTTLPVRLRIDRHATLAALIQARSAEALGDRAHAATPPARLQELSGLPRDVPLFDTILSMETGHPAELGSGGRPLFENLTARDRSHYPLAVLVKPGSRISLVLQYHRQHHDDGMARTVLGMLATALTALPDRLDAPPATLDVMQRADAARAKHGLENATPVPALGLVTEAFGAAAARNPEVAAVAGPDGTLSYGELDRRSAAWAGVLAARGLGPGDRVAILLARGSLVPMAMLAALRAGTAYVPFDAGHVSQRTAAALGACGASVVLTDAAGAALLPRDAPPALRVDEAPPPNRGTLRAPGSDDLAYAMYTSGSTGVPKGVAVTHGNLAYSTAARLAFYEATPRAFLMLPSFAFDSSVAGLYWTLCTGGTVVVPPQAALFDVTTLADTIADAGVTHVLGLPSLLDLVAEHAPAEKLASLAVVIAAGEPLTGATVRRCRRAFSGARIFNEYGPTEATVWCAACDVTAHDAGPVPIGGPIPGGRLVVRDRRGRPVPDGLPGELFVGGPGVAAGYLGRPETTAEHFVEDPDAGRLYCTGDLVRLRPDGMFDYLGRTDTQVKIRGHRIEPAEIETLLADRPDVRQAAVVPLPSPSGTRLAAYVVPGTPAPGRDTLRGHLRRALPEWMLPHHLVLLDALPRTVTGKLDSNALPPPDDAAGEIVAPRTPLERRLAEIWREVLSLDRDIGIGDDFRELGGDSLLSIRLVGEIEAALGLRLPLAATGSITTISNQSAVLETVASAPTAPAAPVPAQVNPDDPFAALAEDELRQMHAYLAGWPGERAYPESLFFARHRDGRRPPLFWCFNGGEEFAALTDALGPEQPVFGLRSGNLVLDLSAETQQRNNRRLAMQVLPEVLRLQPDGPVYLGGNCQGSAVAMELALALQALGRPVAIVFLMEAIPMHAFHGRTALILGRDSDYNPFADFASPELAWSRRYLRHSVDVIAGGHGDFFDEPNVRELARLVAERLAEARADTPIYLADTDCRIVWSAPEPLAAFAPGETRAISLRARNAGPVTWQPTPQSGLRLAARWCEPDRTWRHAGHADIKTAWAAGETREVSVPVAGPRHPGEALLEIDIAEEGVARFADRGASPLRLHVSVDAGRSADAVPVAPETAAEGAITAPPDQLDPLPALLDAARSANWKGDYAAASAMLADVGAAAPALLAELARAEAARGNGLAAERAFRQALALDPACADALFGLGRLRFAAGRPLAALRLFRRGLRVREDPEIRYLAGRAAARLNIPRRALGRLRREARRLNAPRT